MSDKFQLEIGKLAETIEKLNGRRKWKKWENWAEKLANLNENCKNID